MFRRKVPAKVGLYSYEIRDPSTHRLFLGYSEMFLITYRMATHYCYYCWGRCLRAAGSNCCVSAERHKCI